MTRRRSLLRSVASTARRIATRLVARAALVEEAGRAAIPSRRQRVVELDDVRRRLELLVTAVYDRPIPIVTAAQRRRGRPSLWERFFAPRHLRPHGVLPSTDGERIQLPREIESGDAESAMMSYRLLTVQQAERIARGTPWQLAAPLTPLERDLYHVRDSAEVEEAIARNVPGLRGALSASRAAALAARPPLPGMTRVERAVEAIVRQVLAGRAAENLTWSAGGGAPRDMDATISSTPEASLAWARARAAEVSALGGTYRGMAPVFAWGTVTLPASARAQLHLPHAYAPPTLQGGKYGVGRIGRGSGKGGSQASDVGTEEGTSDDPRRGETVPDPGSRKRAVDGRGGKASAKRPTADATESAPDATESAPDADHPANVGDADSERRGHGSVTTDGKRRARGRRPEPKVAGQSVEYAEWDWQAGDYLTAGAIVHSRPPDVGDDAWGNAVLAEHGPLVRRLRERFDRLRARRVRLNQQRDGDELDLAACVRAIVDQRTGHTVDDRLYLAVRPARRGLAICLLIDISGSTDEWIDAKRRVIDVEKIALLLASEALDALGDAYAILTLSGKGRTNVRMRTIKSFDEANGALIRRRIAALEPEGYTRAGAAIRHAATLLDSQPAAHRLLLIISDGKPNDVDTYEGLHGVEDTRQAIQEARAQGVYPFCLTIDRQGPQYLGRIFGEAGHTVLRNPSQLPLALVKVVKHLLAS